MSDTHVQQLSALLSDAAALARELDDQIDRHHPAQNPLEWVLIRIAQAQQRIPDLMEAL